jgi:hypothetical protein
MRLMLGRNRMQRYEIERRRTQSQWKLHWEGHVLTGAFDCPCDRQPGRFRKRRAFGHRRKCYLCHSAKYYQHPRRREIRAQFAFREGLDELVDESSRPGSS